jgi:predicted RNA-binding protein with PIN domain
VALLVDGMNVIGSRPDGWWRDRPKARRELVAKLAPIANAGETVTVVFDGAPSPAEEDQTEDVGIRVLFAPGGPDAADRLIVKILEDDPQPEVITVVTSDAALAEDARRLGARVQAARAFRTQLGR